MDPLRRAGLSSVRPSHSHKVSERDSEPDEDAPQEDSFSHGSNPEEELDDEEEFEEGERHQEELTERHGLWLEEETEAFLQDCLEELLPYSRRPEVEYVFAALDTTQAFASSCSNGTIFFSRGLLETLTEEQVLFFAAHEMAHTELRHFASRKRRLEELRRQIPAAPGTLARHRLETAAVLVVRHLEEFEADHLAGEWLSFELGTEALSELHKIYRERTPDALNRPTHPAFEKRIQNIQHQAPAPEPLSYLFELVPH